MDACLAHSQVGPIASNNPSATSHPRRSVGGRGRCAVVCGYFGAGALRAIVP